MYYSSDKITRMCAECLKIANLTDRKGEQGKDYIEELGLGYLAFSGILRDGVKAVIDLQKDLALARAAEDCERVGKKAAKDFLEDIFGDRDIETISEKDKERIKTFVRQIEAEWDEEEQE